MVEKHLQNKTDDKIQNFLTSCFILGQKALLAHLEKNIPGFNKSQFTEGYK